MDYILVKCLYQSRKVSGHLFVCQRYRFWYLILGLLWPCGICVLFCFLHFITCLQKRNNFYNDLRSHIATGTGHVCFITCLFSKRVFCFHYKLTIHSIKSNILLFISHHTSAPEIQEWYLHNVFLCCEHLQQQKWYGTWSSSGTSKCM